MTARLLGEMEAYAQGHERPLGSFLIIMGAYGAAATGMAAFVAVRGRRLPDRLTWSDLALLAVATHKLSRQIAKDPVTSPIRAPFTRYAGTSAEAELDEEVRGAGLRKALGESTRKPLFILTKHGQGYYFNPDVRVQNVTAISREAQVQVSPVNEAKPFVAS